MVHFELVVTSYKNSIPVIYGYMFDDFMRK